MSKFCTSCGAALSDDAGFCTSCGAKTAQAVAPQPAPVVTPTPVPAGATVAQGTPLDSFKKKVKEIWTGPNRNKIIGIAAIAVVAIIVLCILASLLGGGYKKPIDNLFKGMEKGDEDKFFSAFPKEAEDQFKSYSSILGSSSSFLDSITDELEDKYGDDIKISYKVKDKDKMDKDDLDDLEDDYKDKYDEKVKITKGYELTLDVTIKGDDDKDTDDMDITVLKIDGDWYVDFSSFDVMD
ncbi:MAG: zinc ribbon domain-containing protein [Oscillospiraceae bacterium]